jgi:hypothetical protein
VTHELAGGGISTPLVPYILGLETFGEKEKRKALTLDDFARLRFRQAKAEFKKDINKKSKELPKDNAPMLYLRANGRLHDLFQLTKKGDREAARYLLSLLTDNVERFLNFCSKTCTFTKCGRAKTNAVSI